MADPVLFSALDIPEFYGNGPEGCYCPYYAGRRELWAYALSLVEDPALAWCEFGVGDGESLDWFALRKPRRNTLFAFDHFKGIPEAWNTWPAGTWEAEAYLSNRKDLKVVHGLFEHSLSDEAIREIGRVGMLHVDCDLYSSTATIFQRLGSAVQPGTVIIFDEFYNYPGWEQHEAKAFQEFVLGNKIEFEYLGRTPSCQVALRVTNRGQTANWTVRQCNWSPLQAGIGIRTPRPASIAPRPAPRLRRVLGSIKRRVLGQFYSKCG